MCTPELSAPGKQMDPAKVMLLEGQEFDASGVIKEVQMSVSS